MFGIRLSCGASTKVTSDLLPFTTDEISLVVGLKYRSPVKNTSVSQKKFMKTIIIIVLFFWARDVHNNYF